MFTLKAIAAAHLKASSGKGFPEYIQAIKAIGVAGFETFVADGHTQYFGTSNFTITSEALYNPLTIAASTDADTFKKDLKSHQQGHTDFPTFCKDCAKSGINKWVVLHDAMTCTYYDQAGAEVLVEKIPEL